MFKTTLSALALTALAGGAFAMEAPSSGAAQLAAKLGVEPGVYSLSDLIRLDAANDSQQNREEVAFILEEGRFGIAGRSNAGAVSATDHAQLAARAGVESGQYTIAELALIDTGSRSSNDVEFVEFVKDGGLRDAGPSSADTPAFAQIAGTLNVDAADFTASQLIRLQDAAKDGNRTVVRAILNEAGSDASVATVLR